MAVTKTRLGRQYVYAPLTDLNFNLGSADVHRVAFLDDPTAEPTDVDWVDAIVVTEGHTLYHATIGDALAVLVGPDRGDAVSTQDLATGLYLMWSDTSTPTSDERIVEWHGTVEIVTAPGTFG